MATQMKGYVKKETMLLVAVGAVVVGFLAGIVFSAIQEPAEMPPVAATRTPMQTPIGEGGGSSMSQGEANQIMSLEKELAANPKNADALVALGNIWYDSDKPEKAIDAYEKYLAIRPKDANVLTDLGTMYRRAGEPKKAIAAFNKAIAADPKHEASFFNKGLVYIFDLKDTAKGLKAWEDLVAINPGAQGPDGKLVSKMISDLKAQEKK